jgi:superfamily II DNA or RNA helicase
MSVAPCFRAIPLRAGYESAWGGPGEILDDFLLPVFSAAIDYCRTVGYFSSGYLSTAAAGVSRFIHNGGRIRLLIGAQVYQHDVDALTGKIDFDSEFARRLATELVPEDEIARRRLEVLAWLYQEGRLSIKIAIPCNPDGSPYIAKDSTEILPYWHKKIGYFTDSDGHQVAFTGSLNDSTTALTRNSEDISVYKSWKHKEHFEDTKTRFEGNWEHGAGNFKVYDLPSAVKEKLLTFAPAETPISKDVCEVVPFSLVLPDPLAQARAIFAYYAPRLENAAGLADATSGITLQPHQRQVSYRLANLYPRSWIVADEVGLGKTISAGISLRRLLLSQQIKRALVLAPANLCINWQNELFEKFGLWLPRLVNNMIVSPNPKEEPRPVAAGDNPYLREPLLIVSSHLARRVEQAAKILAAAQTHPFDLVIIDEAHHARFSGTGSNAKRNRLLSLLEGLHDQRAARSLWLLTATPLQTSVTDLHCLLRIVGLRDPFDSLSRFERYYGELIKPKPNWSFIQGNIRRFRPLDATRPYDDDEQAFLKSLVSRLAPSNIERIKHFTEGTKDLEATTQHPDFVADQNATRELRNWLRLHGPVERHITRHTRSTLRAYIARGLLNQPLATRDVSSPAIKFSSSERDLLNELNGHIKKLEAAVGNTGRRGLVLSVYQQRLSSSWASIEMSLRSRLSATPIPLTDDDDDDAADDESINHTDIVPLLPGEVEEIKSYVERIAQIKNRDSKIRLLESCIKDARDSGQAIIVFTQFTDTLEYLLGKIAPVYREVLATYTGDGGRRYQSQKWVSLTKADLVFAVKSGAVQILLATDAAAEGLNLQSCSYLVNYDMPWNPMRVEQRIGRIDRLGQQRPTVTIRNFFVSDTERSRYRALADRIRDFNKYLGGLPPILGVVEPDFIRNPLDDTVERISIDDQLPIPTSPPSPITSTEYRMIVQDALHLPAALGSDVSWDLTIASADQENWRAPATYGHPDIDAELAGVANHQPQPLAVATDAITGLAAVAEACAGGATLITRLSEISNPSTDGIAAECAAEALHIGRLARIQRITQYQFQGRPDMRQETLRSDCIALMKDIVKARTGYELFTTGSNSLPSSAFESAVTNQEKLHYLRSLGNQLEIRDHEIFEHVSPKALPRSEYTKLLGVFEKRASELFERFEALRITGA